MGIPQHVVFCFRSRHVRSGAASAFVPSAPLLLAKPGDATSNGNYSTGSSDSLPEAMLRLQMVDRLDEGLIPPSCGGSTYSLLHDLVARAIFRTHVEGKLKAEIIQDPARFVGANLRREPLRCRCLSERNPKPIFLCADRVTLTLSAVRDPDIARTLLDQREAVRYCILARNRLPSLIMRILQCSVRCCMLGMLHEQACSCYTGEDAAADN